MKRYVYSAKGNKLLRVEEAVPVCGDYCDTCGDCLYHNGGEPCYQSQGGEHFWVVYEAEAPTPARCPGVASLQAMRDDDEVQRSYSDGDSGNEER